MTSENTVHRHPILTSELQILQTYISCNLANHRCFPWLKMTFLPFCITSSSCHYTGVSNGRPKVGGRKRNTLIWSDFIFIRELSLGLSIEIKRGIIFPPDIQLVYPCFTPCLKWILYLWFGNFSNHWRSSWKNRRSKLLFWPVLCISPNILILFWNIYGLFFLNV